MKRVIAITLLLILIGCSGEPGHDPRPSLVKVIFTDTIPTGGECDLNDAGCYSAGIIYISTRYGLAGIYEATITPPSHVPGFDGDEVQRRLTGFWVAQQLGIDTQAKYNLEKHIHHEYLHHLGYSHD